MPNPRSHYAWQLRTRTVVLGPRTVLMGILNVTPDSFSDGSLYLDPKRAEDHAHQLLEQGADLLDLGAESTRPNAIPISAAEEQQRLLPALRAVRVSRPRAILSVDTYHAATAYAALQEGAEIVNDVSGLQWDPGMAAVLAAHRPGVILMHTRGTPQTWLTLAPLSADEVVSIVRDGLHGILAQAAGAHIPSETIVLDAGFGFGKLGVENFALLAHLHQLQSLRKPILVGLSRKRFLTASNENPTPEQREQATSAAHTAAILAGAHILRTHNVSQARTTAAVADAILAAG